LVFSLTDDRICARLLLEYKGITNDPTSRQVVAVLERLCDGQQCDQRILGNHHWMHPAGRSYYHDRPARTC